MSQFPLLRQQVLYTSDHVTVHKGLIVSENRPVAIKETTHLSITDANISVREGFAMRGLVHDNICKVYDCYLEEQGGRVKTVLVEELMESDLAQETEKRRQAGAAWTDYELYYLLMSIVGALSYAEKQGICHRDIKPQNIFYSQGVVKVGDFGAFTVLKDADFTYSLQGSPLYLSPELKRGYIQMLTTGERNLQYDPIKSDVYSLGMTMLHLAKLAPPSQLSSLATLAADTQSVLSSIASFPYMQFFLTYMLQIDEGNRPTFTGLTAFFEQIETAVVDEPAHEEPPQKSDEINPELKPFSGYPSLGDCRGPESRQMQASQAAKPPSKCWVKDVKQKAEKVIKKEVANIISALTNLKSDPSRLFGRSK